jgi:nitrate/nitrite transporter NarK
MKNIIVKAAAIIAAIILLQTLYFKFTAQPESVYIFSTLGLEPYGRIGSGVFELIASILLLLPKTRIYGAISGLGVISGAIFSHLFVLGIEVQNDGGTLFYLAITVFICCLSILIIEKENLINLVKMYLK